MHPFEIARGIGRQSRCQFTGRLIGHGPKRCVIRHAQSLPAHSLGEFRASITEGHAPHSAYRIQVATAFSIADPDPFGFTDDQRRLFAEGRQVCPRVQNMLLIPES
ncbi:hypothetical protein D3C85_1292820 [compost metagenome]